MKTIHSLERPSRSFRSWLAGTFLIIACVLFIISHIYIRWSTFPFEYRNIGSVYSGLWRRSVIYGTRTVTFRIRCALERNPCTKLIIARYNIMREEKKKILLNMKKYLYLEPLWF
ncbi:hypothetical protein I4U23_029564 [Adineta vaga]|nr:hypothetical protein I4U23_029564 [Adineta vaga]